MSIDQVHTAVDSLVATVESIRASSEDVSRRMTNLEAIISGLPRSAVSEFGGLRSIDEEYGTPSRQEHNGESDSINTCTGPVSVVEQDINSLIDFGLETRIMISDVNHEREADRCSIDTDLEMLLQGSRAYSHGQSRNSQVSYSSCNKSRAGWSSLSCVSLSQVTNLSVLSLPISMHELWNKELYHARLGTRQFDDDFKVEREAFSPPNRSETRNRKAWISRRWLVAKSEGRSRKAFPFGRPISQAPDSDMVHRRQDIAFEMPQVKLLLTGTFVFKIEKTNVKGLDALTFFT